MPVVDLVVVATMTVDQEMVLMAMAKTTEAMRVSSSMQMNCIREC